MSCERYEDGLIDVALGLGGNADLEVHLSTCVRCRARLEKERRLTSVVERTLASALDVEPRPGFETRLNTRLAAQTRQSRARWVLVAASATAVVSAAILVHRHPTPESAPSRTPSPLVAKVRPTSVPAPAQVEAVPAVAQPTHRAVARSRPKAGLREPEIVVEPNQGELLLRLARGLRATHVTAPPPEVPRLGTTGLDPMPTGIPTVGRWEAPSGEIPTQWPEWETAADEAGTQVAVRRPL
jgi:hypothetical protein